MYVGIVCKLATLWIFHKLVGKFWLFSRIKLQKVIDILYVDIFSVIIPAISRPTTLLEIKHKSIFAQNVSS